MNAINEYTYMNKNMAVNKNIKTEMKSNNM